MHYLYHNLITNNDTVKTRWHFEFELYRFYSTNVSVFTNEFNVTKYSEETQKDTKTAVYPKMDLISTIFP